ncbi:putative ribosome biogenesis GTPase RsgA 2 [Jeotgalicoccus coquinae]|uniref:Small ribosomal subunit biogenesis GTPase RsgA n=1 Tax=Jeotgalicoccus coquinae TaxID=709509 RepID=A0A6V7RJW3_9STAP|nr:ribosome small subunit-dependent GTPase A [Jeotgalicoccus coquinae]MBB6422566.1 ribosome biogenesis GTPase [Jeotgalicoccus coquinae]GGE14864.1 putative ribosome biogenesis GTPase RsgA 2 [Jeotgalicoccus coquinae]CAD2078050.1 Putative ribosome biogenesis GTPase RsgA [Jeotgalicoccus coquinae]
MQTGKIIKALSGFYYVESNDKVYETRARGRFRKTAESPLVGDYVEFQIENVDEGYITAILPRKNSLIRPQVANIDQLLLTASLKSPDFSFYLLDRFIAYSEANDIDPVIIVTKNDLNDDESLIEKIKSVYGPVYEVHFTDKAHINEDLADVFNKKTSVLAGQSGAGKSTLLNTLLPHLDLKTDEISNALNRGKHTTRHVELISIDGGFIADTPGFATIDFLNIDKYNIKFCFVDFNQYNCKFRECLHINEPKCGVKAAVESGELAQSRYDSYVKIYNEIDNRKERY